MASTPRTDIDHPASFTEGVRVLLLMQRAKDGGSAKTDRAAVTKVVTQSSTEFLEELAKLRGLWKPDYRIYSTINARSLDKAIRIFKYRQLDADYFAQSDREAFYLDLDNRWISCLKDNRAAAPRHNLFLIDIDIEGPEDYPADDVRQWLQQLGHHVHDYKTRNGDHFICHPFNPAYFMNATKWAGKLNDTIHKNALMLWSY